MWRRGTVPDAEEDGPLAGSGRFGLFFQRIDVVDAEDGAGHVPRQAHDAHQSHQEGQYEQVQVITAPFLKNRFKNQGARLDQDFFVGHLNWFLLIQPFSAVFFYRFDA